MKLYSEKKIIILIVIESLKEVINKYIGFLVVLIELSLGIVFGFDFWGGGVCVLFLN